MTTPRYCYHDERSMPLQPQIDDPDPGSRPCCFGGRSQAKPGEYRVSCHRSEDCGRKLPLYSDDTYIFLPNQAVDGFHSQKNATLRTV